MPNSHDTLNEIRTALGRAKYIGVETGTLGKLESGAWVFDVPSRPGFFYVKVERGQSVSYREALALGVRRVPGLRVVVDTDQNGDRIILRAASDEILTNGFAAINASVAEHSHSEPVPVRRLLPGLVYPTSPASLRVRVEPFAYGNNGAWVYYPGGTLDLTSNLPGTANKRRLVLVGIDPLTNTASAVNGSDYSTASVLTAANIQDISIGSLIPLAAVNVYNGMSTISKESQFIDARIFLSAATGSGSSLDNIITDANGDIVLDANSDVLYSAA